MFQRDKGQGIREKKGDRRHGEGNKGEGKGLIVLRGRNRGNSLDREEYLAYRQKAYYKGK